MHALSVARCHVSEAHWNEFVMRHPDGWWFHTTDWIDYALAYTLGSVDASMAMIDSAGGVVGVMPIVRDASEQCVNGGQPVVCPLGIYVYQPAIPCRGRPRQLHGPTNDRTTYVLDLDRPEPVLWRNLRRSYHGEISRAESLYNIRTYDHVADVSPLGEARLVHIACAGRETRPQSTWNLMGKWLHGGQAVLAVARTGDGSMRAFTYTLSWKGWAYYASSAALSRGVAHALIWHTIRALKLMGVRHFELGYAAHDGADQKAQSIAFFKRGFGGELWLLN